MKKVQEVSAKYEFEIANVFHAGDGNLHPCILFDQSVPGEQKRVLEAGAEVMRACVDAGGALTGEHGVGFEKKTFMPWLYTETDLEHMGRIRSAWGNDGLLNPCKILPLRGRLW